MPKDNVVPRLLRASAAAAYLSISLSKLYALVRSGDIPIVREQANASFRFDRTDLDTWIKTHKLTVPTPRQYGFGAEPAR